MSKKVNDARILEALLNEPNVTRAARAARVSRETVYTRLRDPVFVARLEAELDARRNAASTEAVKAVQAACERLLAVLENPIAANTKEQLKAVELALRFLQ